MRITFFNQKLIKKNTPVALTVLLGAALLLYTSLRAIKLSMTHDESSSFTFWMNVSVWKCFFSPDCWGTANLHWLYVFLMKPAVNLFGDSEWAIRFPSLLGHLVYLLFSFRLSKMWAKNEWLALASFMMLNLNPFLLDFFSLARGYGIAMTFIMVSIFCLGQYVKKGTGIHAFGAIGAAFLAVLSNFTTLLFYASLLAVMFCVALLKFYQHKQSLKTFFLPAIAFTGSTIILLSVPISTLMTKGEFEYGTPEFIGTFESLVKTSLYGLKYFSMYHVEVLGGILVLMLMAGLALSVSGFIQNMKSTKSQFLLAGSLLPLFVTIASVSQHYLLGSEYLINRTALLFIPIVAVAVFLFIVLWTDRKLSLPKAIVTGIIALFCTVHSIRAVQLKYTSEWFYDHNTKEVVSYLDSIVPEGQTVKFGVHWVFYPTIDFYINTRHQNFAEPLVYSKEIRTDGFFDYYYVPGEFLEQLQPLYETEKMFNGTGFLLRKKPILESSPASN